MDAAINANTTSTNMVDAIWNLIQCQSASVRKALAKRIVEADEKRKTQRQQNMVKKTLGRALDEVREAKLSGKELMSFDEFLEEVNA